MEHQSYLSRQPIPLLVPARISIARHWQVALLQLLLNHLPASHGDLLVDGANLSVVHGDIGQLVEGIALLEHLG